MEFCSQFSCVFFLKFLTFNTGCALETVRITKFPSEIDLAENQLPGNLHCSSLFPEEKREELREIRNCNSLLPLGQSLRVHRHTSPQPGTWKYSCCQLLPVGSLEYCALLESRTRQVHTRYQWDAQGALLVSHSFWRHPKTLHGIIISLC